MAKYGYPSRWYAENRHRDMRYSASIAPAAPTATDRILITDTEGFFSSQSTGRIVPQVFEAK